MSETIQTQAPLINIRNFCIIAHIDHGKSTLADRLLEKTGTIPMRQMQAQVLDRMDLERERGITIKAKAVRMIYKNQFILNLIDTPGHVDFSYEVSRSLAACEGALLVVDASQGVEAQTLANTLLAQESGLELIPVINKIDLPQADIEGTARQIKDILKIEKKAIAISAKEGKGIEELLDMIVELIPPPKGEVKEPLSALVFDSLYDPYKGVIIFVRVFSGLIQPKKTLLFLSNGIELTPEEVGYLTPLPAKSNQIMTGEVGYVVTGLKDIHLIQIGDTLTEKFNPTSKSLPGYRPTKPFVFAGLYPPNPSEYETLKNALEKLHLSDSSFQFQPESSNALGFGYRCGFLGLLHLEIIKERLLREFSIDVLLTSPNVIYQIKTKQGTGQENDSVEIDSPSKFPSYDQIESIGEPIVNTILLLPAEYVGPVMQMAKERRGEFKDMRYLTPERVLLRYHMPLAEIIIDFHDALKSLTKGYASFDYEPVGYRKDDLVKLEILIHHEAVDAFSSIVHKDKAYSQGKALVEKLRELIPKHLFEIAIQAQVHNKIIARETIKAFRKDVIAKCYGGDISRKRKLLEKQKEGKRKMKQIGNVEIPNEAFLSILQLSKKS
ncbi:MAG: elongation factor 4 [Elusimicrobia bacterium RIFCSPLOWO2_02_FULL_39_32]|nr:MAG: elongation factor 4 [Elusimicrobia bacterium GWA2_38_7]OGR79595.1 MAG: elongation factor 4 [Elusimicrobia bacterium RIFCSPHIGHO2_02_FULL_39_36]OGR92922.1 MAG: elongation factor 4 [Elusimicrobia bacterium RIFCSPLOWO2_02_FULL_39_32]OGR99705.1 MAG: elongation factor 4 [Elusimicrobia bacterium RIFCSPLOWO2_12_FULL_39_28]